MDFAAGDLVTVSDLATDTGFAEDGAPLKGLSDMGVVVATIDRPPGVALDAENESPSPHVRVALPDGAGAPHEAWFAASRLMAAP